MNELKVVVYFQTAFETHKFTVNREAHISHVISLDILLFNVDVAGLMGGIKKMGNFFSTRENNSTSLTSVRLCWFSLSCYRK